MTLSLGCPKTSGFKYGHDPSMDMVNSCAQSSPFGWPSPMQDCRGVDHYQPPSFTEPLYSMAYQTPYAAVVPHVQTPLIMPQNRLWPSMIVAQISQQPRPQHHRVPTRPLDAAVSISTKSGVTPRSARTRTSRRKLTPDERRQMCLEAEQNPNMKHVQIGGKLRSIR